MRRCIGILTVLGVFLLIWLPHLLSLFFTIKMPWWNSETRNTWNFNFFLLFLGTLGVLLNLYLHVFRPFFYKFKHGSMESYRFISGIPLFSSLAGVYSAFWLTPLIWPCLLATVLLLSDVGGVVWFLIFTWKDDSLWSPRKYNHQQENGD